MYFLQLYLICLMSKYSIEHTEYFQHDFYVCNYAYGREEEKASYKMYDA